MWGKKEGRNKRERRKVKKERDMKGGRQEGNDENRKNSYFIRQTCTLFIYLTNTETYSVYLKNVNSWNP